MQSPCPPIDPRSCLMDVNRVMAILDHISLFGGLTGSQLQCLFHGMKQVSYKAGENIYQQGDPSSSIYIILEGAVRLVFDGANHPLTGTELRLGACFGETSVIGIQAHDASTHVVEDVELLELDKDQLIALFAGDKALFSQLILNIARETCRRLHRSNELLASLAGDASSHVGDPSSHAGNPSSHAGNQSSQDCSQNLRSASARF